MYLFWSASVPQFNWTRPACVIITWSFTMSTKLPLSFQYSAKTPSIWYKLMAMPYQLCYSMLFRPSWSMEYPCTPSSTAHRSCRFQLLRIGIIHVLMLHAWRAFHMQQNFVSSSVMWVRSVILSHLFSIMHCTILNLILLFIFSQLYVADAAQT